MGFEPTEPVRTLRLSKPLSSATRSPLPGLTLVSQRFQVLSFFLFSINEKVDKNHRPVPPYDEYTEEGSRSFPVTSVEIAFGLPGTLYVENAKQEASPPVCNDQQHKSFFYKGKNENGG